MIELSVVIPSRDAGTRLIFCLEALGKQRGAGGEFEVIVVDDGSLPPVEPSLHAPGDRFPLRVLRRDVPGGAGAARNVGWQVARGRVILFLDDDVVTGPDVVAAHLAAHADRRPTIGIGRLRSRAGPGAEWLARRFATAWNANVAVEVRPWKLSPVARGSEAWKQRTSLAEALSVRSPAWEP